MLWVSVTPLDGELAVASHRAAMSEEPTNPLNPLLKWVIIAIVALVVTIAVIAFVIWITLIFLAGPDGTFGFLNSISGEAKQVGNT